MIGLSVLMLMVWFSFSFRAQNTQKANDPEKLTWMTIEQAEEACKKNPRKIVVDVYTGWCGWCKKMDATTFADPAVVKYVGEKFYAVKLDAEDRNNIIFKERVYKFNASRESNELAVSFLNGQMSYPTTVYLDEKLNVIQSIGGYLDANEFNRILHYFGSNSYKKKSIEEFKKEYKPESAN